MYYIDKNKTQLLSLFLLREVGFCFVQYYNWWLLCLPFKQVKIAISHHLSYGYLLVTK